MPKAVTLKNSVYTKMFVFFIENREFASLKSILERAPNHAIEADTVLTKVLPFLNLRVNKENPDLLDVLILLYKLKFEYENAFFVMIKKRYLTVFDFLN